MSDLVTVRIVGMPLEVMQRSAEHSDELLREFALIREEGSDRAPDRLLALIDELRRRFGAFAAGPRRAMQEAVDRGERTIDLRYDVPAEVAAAAQRLGALLDEADEFCRAGDLLTVATEPEAVAFRRWYLGEFQRQIAGEAPRPWSTVTGLPGAVMNDAAGG